MFELVAQGTRVERLVVVVRPFQDGARARRPNQPLVSAVRG
jgi:hypothetical protein